MHRKKIQLNLRKVPSHVEIYIFGSFLSSIKPNDVDLIIIYDSDIYTGITIFENCKKLIDQINEKCYLPVDVTYLSKNEEVEIGFVEIVKAIPINNVFNLL